MSRRSLSSTFRNIIRIATVAVLGLGVSSLILVAPAHAEDPTPVKMTLTSLSGEPAALHYLQEQNFVTGFGTTGAEIESIETGCRFEFVAVVLAGGRVSVDFEVTCTEIEQPVAETRIRTKPGSQVIQEPVLNTFHVDEHFVAMDSQTVEIIPSGGGEPVYATPHIVVNGTGADPMVVLEIRLPAEVALRGMAPGLYLQELKLAHQDQGHGMLRNLDRRYLVTGYQAGEVKTDIIETGCTLTSAAQIQSSGYVRSDLAVNCRILNDPIEEFPVRTPFGRQLVQQPVLHTLALETQVTVADGGTVALGGVVTKTDEAFVFVTPRIIPPDGAATADQVLVAAKVIEIGSSDTIVGTGGLAPQLLESLRLVSVIDRQSRIEDITHRQLVTGFDTDRAVPEIVDTGCTLVTTPGLTAAGAVRSDLALTCTTIDEPVDTYPVRTPRGRQNIQLPVLHTVQLETQFEVPDGHTVVLGGVAGANAETLVFFTPDRVVPLTPAPTDQIHMEAKVISVDEGAARTDVGTPASSSQADLRLLTLDQRESMTETLTERYRITGFAGAEPVVTPTETGCSLIATTVLLGDVIQADVRVARTVSDEPAETFAVSTPKGAKRIQQPVRHALTVDTGVDIGDGETIALGGVMSIVLDGEMSEQEESLVFLTARSLPGSTDPQLVLESKVLRAVPGEPPAADEPPGIPFQAELSLSAPSGQPVTVNEPVLEEVVVDTLRGKPVVVPLDTGFLVVDYLPTLLPGGDIQVELGINWATIEQLDREFLSQCGAPRLQPPTRDSVIVATAFEAPPGQTVALTSALTSDDVIVFATVDLVGDPPTQEISLVLKIIGIKNCP